MKHKRYARYRGWVFIRLDGHLELFKAKDGETFYYHINLKSWRHGNDGTARTI